jgi:hypothetical protein
MQPPPQFTDRSRSSYPPLVSGAGPQSPSAADVAALDDIRRRLGTVQRTLDAMLTPPPLTDRSRSFYPPAAAPSVGRVVMRNEYGADVTLILNDRTRVRVPAFQTREIAEVPAGPLTYQVFVDGWGPGAVIATTLSSTRPLSLTVR